MAVIYTERMRPSPWQIVRMKRYHDGPWWCVSFYVDGERERYITVSAETADAARAEALASDHAKRWLGDFKISVKEADPL